MLDAKNLLLLVLAILAAVFTTAWILRIRSKHEGWIPTGDQLFIGYITNFFDTLGIGSFAPTTALSRARGTVSDERLPGTLNIGHRLLTVAQAFFFLKAVEVEPLTLASLIVAAVIGAWFGAGIVAKPSRWRIRQVMGVALLGAAALLACSLLGLAPGGAKRSGAPAPRSGTFSANRSACRAISCGGAECGTRFVSTATWAAAAWKTFTKCPARTLPDSPSSPNKRSLKVARRSSRWRRPCPVVALLSMSGQTQLESSVMPPGAAFRHMM